MRRRRRAMIGQAELDAIGTRAAAALELARERVNGMGHVQDAALLAIAEQIALANALAMVRLARDAGEVGPDGSAD